MQLARTPDVLLSSDDTAIVIPCYNEARRLRRDLFLDYLAQPNAAFLCFVDDGSTDKTIEVVEELCLAAGSGASLLRRNLNAGKAEAVRAGMLHIIRQRRPAFVGFWDADLATPLNTIDSFRHVLAAKSELAMVFGARVKLLGRQIHRDPKRHYLGRVFATIASLVLDLPIYDTQCGAKLFRLESGIERALSDAFLSRWIFDVELIARFHDLFEREGKKLETAIYEYPLESWEDVAGSKVRSSDFAVALSEMWKIHNRYMRRRHVR